MALWEYLGAGSGVSKGIYRLNGNANDSSWNANNGTAQNVTWVWGKIGSGAAQLAPTSGADGGWIAINGLAALDSLTYSAWVKCTGKATVWWQAIYILTTENAAWNFNTAFAIYNTTGYLAFGIYTGNWPPTSVTDNVDLSDSLWHHCLVTRSWANIALYKDGKLISSSSSFRTGSAWGTRATIGANAGTLSTFKGRLDEVIIENRAWTASEIRKYYTYSKGRFWIT